MCEVTVDSLVAGLLLLEENKIVDVDPGIIINPDLDTEVGAEAEAEAEVISRYRSGSTVYLLATGLFMSEEDENKCRYSDGDANVCADAVMQSLST